MKDINILMLAPFYNVYIKEFTETLANYVNGITVVVHHNPLTEISKYLPKRGYIRYLYRYTKNNLIDREGIPDNVNIEIVSLPYFIPDGKNPFLGDRVFKKVNKIIQQKNMEFDILHAHSTWISGYVGAKIKKIYKKPLIITLHHDLRLKYSAKIKDKVTWTWNTTDCMISVNRRDLRNLPNNLQKKSVCIPNGFDPSNVYPIERKNAREALGIPLDKKILFSIGYLIERKGFNYLIDAMKQVIKDISNITCFIAGEGPMKDQLNKQIARLNLEEHVRLVGYIPRSKKKIST